MLEGLLVNQIRGNAQVSGMLATYDGRAAVFYQKVPDDTDGKWVKPCYPRIDYSIDMRDDPERKVSGTLLFNIWCSEESLFMPEDIEPLLIELVSGTFYTNSGKTTICAIWQRSDAFEFARPEVSLQQNKAEPRIFGLILTFDLTAFPVQLTTDPDPIQAMNEYTKALHPSAYVIGHDALPDIWKPSSSEPAVYWRLLSSAETSRTSYAVRWYTCQIAGHIITDSVSERARWIKAIAEELSLAGEVLLTDGSPMFIDRMAVKNTADQLREGQMTITGTYGILTMPRTVPAPRKLMNADFKLERGASNG